MTRLLVPIWLMRVNEECPQSDCLSRLGAQLFRKVSIQRLHGVGRLQKSKWIDLEVQSIRSRNSGCDMGEDGSMSLVHRTPTAKLVPNNATTVDQSAIRFGKQLVEISL
jgi:hypothetical protein